MRDLRLVRTTSCCRAFKDLTILARHIRGLHGPSLVRHIVSNKPSNTTYLKTQLCRKTDNRQFYVLSQAWQSNKSDKRYILHDTELEEVKILAHTHSDIGWVSLLNCHCLLNEPRCEKTSLRGFRPGPTQTGLYKHRRWLEA